jgi:BRCA1-associated RING domain protein 1
LYQDAGRATELKRLPTPINLFEDECVFCHSFRTTEVIQFKSFCSYLSELMC